MSIDVEIQHITPANGNVFLDLGFSKKEAEKLLAEIDRSIDEKLAVKKNLMTNISLWIDRTNLK